jgi:hypothetical protein
VLLIEPEGTPNTGDAGGELTAREEEICLLLRVVSNAN